MLHSKTFCRCVFIPVTFPHFSFFDLGKPKCLHTSDLKITAALGSSFVTFALTVVPTSLRYTCCLTVLSFKTVCKDTETLFSPRCSQVDDTVPSLFVMSCTFINLLLRRRRVRRSVWKPSSNEGPACASETSGAAPPSTWRPPVAAWGPWEPCCRPIPPRHTLSHTSQTIRATRRCTGPATTV